MTLKTIRAKIGVLRRCASILIRRPRLGVHVWIPGNAYSDLLYRQFRGLSTPHPMTLLEELEAFTHLGSKNRILWIHSEASYSWGRKVNELAAAHRSFLRSLERWSRKGGRLVWTVHDDGLHLNDPDVTRIAKIRAKLREMADFVHVHSEAAKALVVDKFRVEADRVVVVPHPSYAPLYPEISIQATGKRLATAADAPRHLLSFGHVKRYKNYDHLAEALEQLGAGSFARLAIAGKIEGDLILPEDSFRRNVDLDLQLRFIPDEEVPTLFADAHFLVLPYIESLTSAAAALAMGFGIPVIAPDLGGMRESVPVENWPLIYSAEEPDGLASALRWARDMPKLRYCALADQCRAFGEALHPDRISADLRTILSQRGIF